MESHGLFFLDFPTLFGKLTEHENELKRLAANKVNVNKKKVKEEKSDIFQKSSTSKRMKVKEDDESYDKDSRKKK